MSDEFVKEVLGEEAVKSGKPKKLSGKKKIVIGSTCGLILIGIAIVAVILLWPKKTEESKASESYLSGLDVLCAPNGIMPAEDGSFLITDVYGKLIWTAKGNHAEVYAGAESVKDLHGEPMGGYNDASLEESLFKEPWAIVPFLDGYAVSDTGNGSIRLIRNGEVQTVNGRSDVIESGDMGVTFDKPTGLAADNAGNLYVADTGRGTIYLISAEGNVGIVKEGLDGPMGLCWYDGTLYVAETGADRVVGIKNGELILVAGSGEEGDDDGPAMTATFSAPQGVTVGPDGTVYIADTLNASVRRVKNGIVDTIMKEEGDELKTYPMSPTGMCIKDGVLYVCDCFSRRVYAISL